MRKFVKWSILLKGVNFSGMVCKDCVLRGGLANDMALCFVKGVLAFGNKIG